MENEKKQYTDIVKYIGKEEILQINVKMMDLLSRVLESLCESTDVH